MDPEIIWMLYGLDESVPEPEQLTAAVAHRSSGATCEELVLLTFSDEEIAQTATKTLAVYLDTQILSNKDYRPAEIPKLEKAFLECRGNTVLLMVANDFEAAHALLPS